MGDNADDGVTAGGYSSIAGIEAALKKMSTEVKCVDRVMIYIVGHGLKPGGRKYGKKWASGGIILQGKKGSERCLKGHVARSPLLLFINGYRNGKK